MNNYTCNIRAYSQLIAHLTLIEEAIYARLLRRYYAEDSPIVNDTNLIRRWVGARSEVENSSLDNILNEFFVLDDGVWRNERADIDIAAYRNIVEKNRKNGLSGGRPKIPDGQVKPAKKTKKVMAIEEVKAVAEEQTAKANQAVLALVQSAGNQDPADLIEKAQLAVNAGIAAATAQAAVVSGTAKPLITMHAYLEDCKLKSVRPIRDYKSLWEYVDTIKLPVDYVALAWAEFCRRLLPGGSNPTRRQKDWPRTFRVYIENNYLKLWATDGEGKYFLTTQGKQAEKYQNIKSA